MAVHAAAKREPGQAPLQSFFDPRIVWSLKTEERVRELFGLAAGNDRQMAESVGLALGLW